MLVAQEVARRLKPGCERIIIAGSIRRGVARVGDVEIVYIPKTEVQKIPGDFFAQEPVNLANEIILRMEGEGVLARRENANGSTMYGPKNKLMEHCASGIPVDLFATNASSWFNYLVCRTGPAESNTLIAIKAQKIGWHWNPYGSGFVNRSTQIFEEKVFAFVGMPQPPKRVEIPI
jgi:DNA polymerase/3'-5' exonuclease PolX